MDAVCLQCGYSGWDNAYRYCAICQDPRYAVHHYCLDVIPETCEPVRWTCEDCEPPKKVSVPYEMEYGDLPEDVEAMSDSVVVSAGNSFSEGGPQHLHDASPDLTKCADESSNTSFPMDRVVTEQDDVISTDETNRCQLVDKEKDKHDNLLDNAPSKENVSKALQRPIKKNGTVEEGHVSEVSPQRLSNSLPNLVKCAEPASMMFPTECVGVTDKDAFVGKSSEQVENINESADGIFSQSLEKENLLANEISTLVHQKENKNEETDKRLENIPPLNVSSNGISSQALENENSTANEMSTPMHQKENECEATQKRLEKLSPLFLTKNNLSPDEILSQLLDEKDGLAHLIYPTPLKMKFSEADDVSSLPLEKINDEYNFKRHVSWSDDVPSKRTKISCQPHQKENTEDNVKQHAKLSNEASSERKMNGIESVAVKSSSKEKEPHQPFKSDAKPVGDLMKSPKKRKKCPNKNWASKKRKRPQKGTTEHPVFGSRERDLDSKRYATGSRCKAKPHSAPYNGSLNRNTNERDRSPNRNWRSEERRDGKSTSERPVIVIPAAPSYGSRNKYQRESGRSPNKNWSSGERRRDRNSRNESHISKSPTNGSSKRDLKKRTDGHGARFQELLRPYENKGTVLKEQEHPVDKFENQLFDIPIEGGLTRSTNNHFESREIVVRESRSYGDRDQTNWNCFPGYSNTPTVGFQQHPEPLPIVKPIWWGSFNVWNLKPFVLDGLMAHLSDQACDKVHEQACQLQRVLQVEMVPKSYIWPRSFQTLKATAENIALYFFPSEISEQAFDHLLDNMMGEDLALRVCMQSAELLIFASVDLPMEFWRFKGKHYLWGVFRGKQVATSNSHSFERDSATASNVPVTVMQHANYGNVLGTSAHPYSPLSTHSSARA